MFYEENYFTVIAFRFLCTVIDQLRFRGYYRRTDRSGHRRISLSDGVSGIRSRGDLAIAIGKEAVCDLDSVQFSLSLPETWDYEIRYITFENVTTTQAIVFWNIAYPDDTFTLVYAPVPGICGTSVTSKEITLPDSNLSGWKYTEIYQTEQKYWIYITLSNPDIPLQGNTLQLKSTLSLTAWDALKADFNRILETVRLQYTSYETPVMQDILILTTPKTEFR